MKKNIFYLLIIVSQFLILKSMDMEDGWEIVGISNGKPVCPTKKFISHNEKTKATTLDFGLLSLENAQQKSTIEELRKQLKATEEKFTQAQQLNFALKKKSKDQDKIIKETITSKIQLQEIIDTTEQWARKKNIPKCVRHLKGKAQRRNTFFNKPGSENSFTNHELSIQAIQRNDLSVLQKLIPQSTELSLAYIATNAANLKRIKALNLVLDYTQQKYPSTHHTLLHRILYNTIITHNIRLFLIPHFQESFDQKEKIFSQAAHFALDNYFKDGLRYLLEHGADVNAPATNDPQKKTLLMKAQGDAFLRIINYFIQHNSQRGITQETTLETKKPMNMLGIF